MGVTVALLDAAWVREPDRYNPATGQFRGAIDPTHFLPRGTSPVGRSCPFWLVEKEYALEAYLDVVAEWLDRNKLKLNRLILSSHGNNGQLFIGRGLKLENAGMFKRLKGSFDMRPEGRERTVSIFGCGVASDTEVALKELPKNPGSWPSAVRNAVAAAKRLKPGEKLEPLKRGDRVAFTLDNVPQVILGGQTTDTLMVQGGHQSGVAGAGYRLLKAIANCTQAYVTAPLSQEINFPPYFQIAHGSLWVYPDTKEQEDRYGLKPHNDGTTDAVIVR